MSDTNEKEVWLGGYDIGPLLYQRDAALAAATARIAALEAEAVKYAKDRQYWAEDERDITELEAENTRLRAILDAVIPSPESGSEPVSGAELLLRMQEERNKARAALERIAAWEMPVTGRTWDDGTPMSYAACYGSNGERDHIKAMARAALALSPPATGAKPEEE